MSQAVPVPHPRAAFKHRDFRYFLSARFLALASHQMMNVALGQWIYEWTHNPLYLGYLGLALFVPKMTFTIFAGHTADHYDRRKVILVCRLLQFLGVLGLALVATLQLSALWVLYVILFLVGVANAFDGPASQAIVPQLVPTPHFSNAVKWNSSTMQMAFIVGPAAAGWLYALSNRAATVLYVVAAMRLASVLLVYVIKNRTERLAPSVMNLKTLLAGIRFVWEKKIILGTISLDLFAVLLGGAVALLPVYANDILKVGASGLGMLRAAPALGAAIMAISMAYLPPLKRAGATMLACVAIFGAATVLFAVSKNFYFSLLSLFILGSSDMVSVIIRGVLVQIKTPHEMRGRVSAVNLIFIGASNELGEFESGLTASLFGTVPAVLIGGVGTLTVVAVWNWLFPEIRRFKKLEESYF
ncbi:MAG: MFS transporter [Deltaproteobacteria bacterium]|nr:MFS transporter [Deltaproteobacteria bacterium]